MEPRPPGAVSPVRGPGAWNRNNPVITFSNKAQGNPSWGFAVLNHPDMGEETVSGQRPPLRNLLQISNRSDRRNLGLNVQCTCRLQVRDA